MIRLDIISDDGLVDVEVSRRIPDWQGFLSIVRSSGGKVARAGKSWRTTVPYERSAELAAALTAAGLAVSVGPGLGATRDATEEAVSRQRSAVSLYPYQEIGRDHLAKRSRALLFDAPGCVDGDAIVRICRAGKSFELSLRELHRRFRGGRTSGHGWDPNIETKIRSLCDGVFRLHPVRDVLVKGRQEVLRLVTDGGRILRLTPDHEVCVGPSLFRRADWLRPGDAVIVNGRPACSRCGTTKNVVTAKYKKFRGQCRKCIYRYARKQGNWKGGRSIDGDGYVVVSGQWGHPRARRSCVYEHVLVMEKMIGRFVGTDEVVHHRDGNKQNNAPLNLELLTISEHMTEHGRAGGFAHLDGSRSAKGGLVVFVPKIECVVSVEPDGEAEVFDVVCEDPHRNFVANGIVVHNCGKTAQALTAIVKIGRPPTLVVCPAHLRQVWQREAAKFAPSVELTVVKSGLMPRWPEPGEVLVVSYESLPPTIVERTVGHVLEQLFGWFRLLLGMPTLNIRPGYDLGVWPENMLLIGDELHFAKDPKARRTRRWRDVGGCAKRIWGLTGTPLLKHPPDLWEVLNGVGVVWQTFGTWERFSELCGGRKVREQVGRFKIIEHTIWDGPVSPAAAEALKPYCLRRLRADVLPELPDKTVETMTEDRMPPKLQRRLDEVWAVLQAARADHPGQDEADWMPTLEGMSEARSLMALAKLPLVEELVSEIDEPVVLWSAHVGVLTKFAAGRPGWATITGHDSFKARDEAVRAFQAGELRGLACSIKAAGTGLTLTASSRAIFVDLDWQQASNEQAEDRQCRIGQKNAVLVTQLVLDHPLDQRVSAVCRWKTEVAAAVLGDAR